MQEFHTVTELVVLLKQLFGAHWCAATESLIDVNAQVRARKGTMHSRPSLEQMPGLIRALGTLGLLVVTAGIAPTLWAQNAPQRAALAKLGAPRANTLSIKAQVNGVEATEVSLDRPLGVAYDAAGNFYIADTDNFVIREVNLAGITTVVAGTGEQGFGGDGGPATSALLDSPEGIALDVAGNLYI